MSFSEKPIGIFDSGLGGLTLVKAIKEKLPYENIVYLGDSLNVPYGDKTPGQITEFAFWNTQFLMEDGVVDQENCDKTARWNTEFFHRVGVYDYWYTPEIPNDIHTDFDNIPHDVEELLRSCTGITPTMEAPAMSGMS